MKIILNSNTNFNDGSERYFIQNTGTELTILELVKEIRNAYDQLVFHNTYNYLHPSNIGIHLNLSFLVTATDTLTMKITGESTVVSFDVPSYAVYAYGSKFNLKTFEVTHLKLIIKGLKGSLSGFFREYDDHFHYYQPKSIKKIYFYFDYY